MQTKKQPQKKKILKTQGNKPNQMNKKKTRTEKPCILKTHTGTPLPSVLALHHTSM